MNHLTTSLGNPSTEDTSSQYQCSYRYVFSSLTLEYILWSGVLQWQNISAHRCSECLCMDDMLIRKFYPPHSYVHLISIQAYTLHRIDSHLQTNLLRNLPKLWTNQINCSFTYQLSYYQKLVETLTSLHFCCYCKYAHLPLIRLHFCC
jgi:hypothetical protein